MQSPPERPFVVTVIPDTPTETTQTSVFDVLIGSVSLTAALLGMALVLGLVLGSLRVGYKKLFPGPPDHMPPVNPYYDFDQDSEPPSSQSR